MSWSSALLSATEQAWAANDKPMISSNSLKRTEGLDIRWAVGTTSGTTGSTNNEDTTYISENIMDGFPGIVSKPNASDGFFTIVIDASASPLTFDWFGILNHNLKTLACTSMRLEIADYGTFTGASLLSTTNINSIMSSDDRFSDLTLFHTGTVARRYSAVQFVRIRITIASGVPQIGQVILGRRRQQQFHPSLPWDSTGERSRSDDFTAPSGMLSRQMRYKARREIDASFRHSTPTEQSDLLSWWDQIDEGGLPFYYHDAPATYPSDFNMMMMGRPSLRYPWTTSTTRDFSLRAVEQGPNFLSQE